MKEAYQHADVTRIRRMLQRDITFVKNMLNQRGVT